MFDCIREAEKKALPPYKWKKDGTMNAYPVENKQGFMGKKLYLYHDFIVCKNNPSIFFQLKNPEVFTMSTFIFHERK